MQLSVKSLIYENATPGDVISAWKTVKEELKLSRLVKLFLRDSLRNLRLTWHHYLEPDLVLILRLVYWYYYCKVLSASFIHKKKEVRGGLIRGRLTNREDINKQLETNLTDQQITNLLNSSSLHEEANNLRNQWFINTWNVTSELLFAGVSGKNGFDVTFVPKPATHDYDYDFLVNGLPAQVYSFNTPVSIRSFATDESLRGIYVEQDRITYDEAIGTFIVVVLATGAVVIDDCVARKFKDQVTKNCFFSFIVHCMRTNRIAGFFTIQTQCHLVTTG